MDFQNLYQLSQQKFQKNQKREKIDYIQTEPSEPVSQNLLNQKNYSQDPLQQLDNNKQEGGLLNAQSSPVFSPINRISKSSHYKQQLNSSNKQKSQTERKPVEQSQKVKTNKKIVPSIKLNQNPLIQEKTSISQVSDIHQYQEEEKSLRQQQQTQRSLSKKSSQQFAVVMNNIISSKGEEKKNYSPSTCFNKKFSLHNSSSNKREISTPSSAYAKSLQNSSQQWFKPVQKDQSIMETSLDQNRPRQLNKMSSELGFNTEICEEFMGQQDQICESQVYQGNTVDTSDILNNSHSSSSKQNIMTNMLQAQIKQLQEKLNQSENQQKKQLENIEKLESSNEQLLKIIGNQVEEQEKSNKVIAEQNSQLLFIRQQNKIQDEQIQELKGQITKKDENSNNNKNKKIEDKNENTSNELEQTKILLAREIEMREITQREAQDQKLVFQNMIRQIAQQHEIQVNELKKDNIEISDGYRQLQNDYDQYKQFIQTTNFTTVDSQMGKQQIQKSQNNNNCQNNNLVKEQNQQSPKLREQTNYDNILPIVNQDAKQSQGSKREIACYNNIIDNLNKENNEIL